MTTPISYLWRIVLRCEHTWLLESVPDLTRPVMCSAPGHEPTLASIWAAERIPPAPGPTGPARLAVQAGR